MSAALPQRIRNGTLRGPAVKEPLYESLIGNSDNFGPFRYEPSLSVPGYMFSVSGRRSEHIFVAPSLFDSGSDGIATQSGFIGPFANTERAAIPRQSPICACISILLKSCRPSAIFRAIVFTSINSINGMFWHRHWPHVGGEIWEPILARPSLTDSNAFAAVILKGDMARIGASGVHSSEENIKGLARTSMRLVCITGTLGFARGLFPSQASARMDAAANHITDVDDFTRTAVALTVGHKCAFASTGECQDCQPVKLLSNNLFGYDAFSHACSPLQNGVFRDARRGQTAAASRYFSRSCTVVHSENRSTAA